MKRLYWLIQSLFNPVYRDEYNRLGEGEYLAKHGVKTDDNVKMISGEAVRKLSNITTKHE